MNSLLHHGYPTLPRHLSLVESCRLQAAALFCQQAVLTSLFAARPSDRYKSFRPCILPVAAVLWGPGISKSRRQENPHPIWHTGGMIESRAYLTNFYKFVATHSHGRIITYTSPNTYRAASHLSATEGDHEAHNHTAFQFTISRSKNAAAAEAERGANNRRSHHADGHRVGASLLVSGPSQPDGKSLVDPRLPL